MFRLVTCVTAACDDCGMDYNDDDSDYGGIFHFADQDQAVECIAEYGGWRVRAGGRLTCRRCAAEQDCATYGHTWDPWRGCRCAGRIGDHTTGPDGTCAYQHRWCDRCLTGQDRPATAPAHQATNPTS